MSNEQVGRPRGGVESVCVPGDARAIPWRADGAEPARAPLAPVRVPVYLSKHYWWAYLHPLGVRFFDHPAVVNLILWGNYRRLMQAALEVLDPEVHCEVLQVACVYGDFTRRLAEHLGPEGHLSVIDVAPVQLYNLTRKVGELTRIRLFHEDSTRLSSADGTFDAVVLFFLLHEQPEAVRRQTLAEALRVLRPGGKLVVIDYHAPHAWHPLRWPMHLILRHLEPFALDMWRAEITHWLPDAGQCAVETTHTFFGGLYQRWVLTKAADTAAGA